MDGELTPEMLREHNERLAAQFAYFDENISCMSDEARRFAMA
jgi:hypothetical protein